jgi:hypothetical protein
VTFTKSAASVLTRRAWLPAFAFVTLLGLPALFIGTVSVLPELPFALRLLLVATFFLAWFLVPLLLMRTHSRWWHRRAGRLHADEDGLSFRGAALVARSEIRHAYHVKHDGHQIVRLQMSHQPIEIEVANDEEASAMLRALRLDSRRSVGVFKLLRGTFRGFCLRIVAWGALALLSFETALFTAGIETAVLALVLSGLAGGMIMQVEVRVVVGVDGIYLRRVIVGRERFVPFSLIESVETNGRDVAFELRDGTTLRMNVFGFKGLKLHDERAVECENFVARIREQIALHDHTARRAEALARHGRSTKDWLQEVARSSDTHASFRTPALAPDELWRVVEDTTTANTARAGAAVALRERLDDQGRERLRILADACAEPHLRVALEAVASDEALLEQIFEMLRDENELVAPSARSRR